MTTRFRVGITDFINDDLAEEKAILGDLADVVAFDAYQEADLIGKIDDCDAVMLYHNLGLSAVTIDRLARCKLIVRCGVGIDNVDREYARLRGIPVANVPDYGTEDVADSAIGLALSLTRGINLYNSTLRRLPDEPWSYTIAAPLHRLRGETFGIVGLGRIGTATALRAKALGMRVVFYDPYLPDGTDKALGVDRVETLSEVLAASLVVSLHCPLTDETRHLIDTRTVRLMRPGSFLVNTGRGALVQGQAVVDAIVEGRLAGAGIDVLAIEPPSADDPIVTAWRDPEHPVHDRLILNPHAAFYCEEGLLDMRRKGSEACRRALLGEPLRNVVNWGTIGTAR